MQYIGKLVKCKVTGVIGKLIMVTDLGEGTIENLYGLFYCKLDKLEILD